MWPLKPNHELIPILTFRITQCHDLDHSGSRDVISHVTIRIKMGHFLLVVHWTQVPICCWCRHWLLMTDSNAELIQKVVHSLKDSCKYIIVTQTKCVIWLSILWHFVPQPDWKLESRSKLSLISLLVSIRTKYWLLMVGGCSRTSLSSASSISCRA